MDACPSGWLDPVRRVARGRAAPFPRQVLRTVPAVSLEARTPPQLCPSPGRPRKSLLVPGLQPLGRHPSPIYLGRGTRTGPLAARRRGGLCPPSGFLCGRRHTSVHRGSGDTAAIWRGPCLQWRRNLVFQIFLNWSLDKMICPTPLAGNPPVPPVPPRGLRDAARPLGTCAHTPG